MTLHQMPSKLPAERFPSSTPESAGSGRGDAQIPSQAIAALDEFIEFSRFCAKCDSEQIFRAGWECDLGLVGCCLGCGDERIAPWTRTCVEVA
jgi:hypothetical protein